MITCKNFGISERGGRLGNALFQWASIIGLSEHYSQRYVLPMWKYSETFSIKFNFGIIRDKCIDVKERNFHHDLNQFNSIRGSRNFNIVGYLQSEKYFGKEKLKFKSPTPMTNELALKHFIGVNKETIGIHVRRGDYVGHPYYYQLPVLYFLEALELIPDYWNKRIMVFSDDLTWCRKYFPKNFEFMDGNSEIQDLYLLSLCDYHILSNSTFGWWGAYLSESKKVIRPKHYFAGEGLKNDTIDFWPKNWVEHG